ncbi:MAG TPA: hypothetical protein VFQ45_07390 [Longimicrobium sp.]|nr:hypothetical protein [Longimicrobium sp.]
MRSPMIHAAAVLAALTFALPAAAQDSDGEWVENCRRNNRRSDRVHHCEVRESRIPARGSLAVDGRQNGGVSVRSWDRNEIEVHARIQSWASSESAARDIAQDIRVRTEGGTVRADGPSTEGRRGFAVNYVIYVPRRMNLDVETHNGPVSVSGVTGRIRLEAVNGPIALSHVNGDVRARAQNGPLAVTLSGSRWSGEGLDAQTVNGPVTLNLPRGYAAHLEASTVNGPFASNIGTRERRDDDERRGDRWSRRRRSINQDINGGGATVRVATTNGPIAIHTR